MAQDPAAMFPSLDVVNKNQEVNLLGGGTLRRAEQVFCKLFPLFLCSSPPLAG